MPTESKHCSESRLSLYKKPLRYIPKAEFNLVLGLSVTFLAYDAECNLIAGLTLLFTLVSYKIQKKEQDELLRKYTELVTLRNYHNETDAAQYKSDIELQKILRGLTHRFFQNSKDEPQDNFGVIKNAMAIKFS